jgi:hypothetical protein
MKNPILDDKKSLVKKLKIWPIVKILKSTKTHFCLIFSHFGSKICKVSKHNLDLKKPCKLYHVSRAQEASLNYCDIEGGKFHYYFYEIFMTSLMLPRIKKCL